MLNTNKKILLFSSCIRELYEIDNYNVLAYPSGFIMHFRYDKKWVDEYIWKNFQELKDKEAIPIAISLNKGEKFVPLRKVNIVDVEKEGSTLHIYFELLNEWIKTDAKTNYDAQIKKFEKRPKRVYENDTSGKFIFSEPFEELEFSEDIKCWENIIEELNTGGTRLFKGIFYRFIGIFEVSNGTWFRLKKGYAKLRGNTSNIGKLKLIEFDNLRKGYEIIEGKRYVMIFSFNFGKKVPFPSEDCTFNIYSPDLVISPTKARLGFRVDKKRFSIFSEKRFNNFETSIMTSEEDIKGPELEIPIKIKRSKGAWVYFALVILGFALISGVIGSFLNYLFNLTWGIPISPEWDPVLKVLGLFLVSLVFKLIRF